MWCGVGVVRRTEGAFGDDPLLPQRSRHGMNFGDFKRLLKGEVGHDGGQTARKHRLARPGRSDEEQIMPARNGDFERAPRNGLSLDVF